jgi:DNA-binding SARP family transcriptional activator
VPQREDIHRESMYMYWKLGAIDDALNQYKLLEDYLQRTVGVRPSRETRELHERIQREGIPTEA